jgi:cytochrome c oxidase cbb3-type subunit 4
MDVNTLRIIVTVASFLVFMGIVAFALYPGNARRFGEAARVPLDDGEENGR